MRALSIRQPYAEAILRGVKTIEYRNRPTRIIGERFYIYAAKGPQAHRQAVAKGVWSRDLAVPDTPPPVWMTELAELLILGKLPTGVIVGTAVIDRVTGADGQFNWHLSDVQRVDSLLKPARHPQPSWFNPF
jgi:predicted transcriptional regulator